MRVPSFPNEQAWISCSWLLFCALPTILGKDISRITIVMLDGDSQETHQINNVIDLSMVHAVRQQCGWHAIDRSWNRVACKVPPPGGSKKSRQSEAKTSRKILFNQWHLWMIKGCETQDEHEVSKQLFVYPGNSHVCTKAVHPHEANFVVPPN
jgi:hypothetical protein